MNIISILCPTRGRPDNLQRSVASVLKQANHPERIEILFRFDEDDHLIAHGIGAALSETGFRSVIIVGKRHGYAGLYHYYNELAAASKGEWLFLWNDDSHFLTKGWDDLLLKAPANTVQFPRRDILSEADPTFPVTHRGVYEAMGHLSLNAHCDAWISDVSWYAKCQVIRNDIVLHHECLADGVARERIDDMPRFKGADQVAVRAIDIEKVKALR